MPMARNVWQQIVGGRPTAAARRLTATNASVRLSLRGVNRPLLPSAERNCSAPAKIGQVWLRCLVGWRAFCKQRAEVSAGERMASALMRGATLLSCSGPAGEQHGGVGSRFQRVMAGAQSRLSEPKKASTAPLDKGAAAWGAAGHQTRAREKIVQKVGSELRGRCRW